MNKAKKENIVKATAKALGMTYKQLGEAIGYSEATINKVSATGEISEPMQKAIELYLNNLSLEKELDKFKNLKNILKDIITG